MRTREKHIDELSLRPMSRGRAVLLKIWGPAESWDNPIMGTRYDPAIRQHHDQLRRAERETRRERRQRARIERRSAHEPPEHYTPDE